MKLATFECDGTESFGVITDRGIVDVRRAWPDGPGSLLEALQAGPEAVGRIDWLAGEADSFLPEQKVRLLAPLPKPTKILALAGNYVEHIRESKLDKGLTGEPHEDTTPRPFIMPNTAVADPGAVVPWPAFSRDIDYEIELAVVIGARAKCVTPDEAVGCVAGYTIVNDVSARSVTFVEGRSSRPWDEFYDWLNGKWADGFLPMGPCMVTADEIGDVRDLRLELTVNGETRQKASTAEMIFDVYEIVSFLSHLMTLEPGDVIATGTPAGVGAGDGRMLKGGDVVTSRIEKIGELTFTLGEPPEQFYTPCKQKTG